MCFAERRAARDLERERRGVDVVVLAVDEARFEVDDLVAGDLAALALGFDRVLDRGNELARNTAADDFVGELDAGARGHRLEDHLHFGVLTRAAALLLVRVDELDGRAERLAEADAWPAHVGFDAELGAHAVDRDLEVQLAHAFAARFGPSPGRLARRSDGSALTIL